MMPPSSARSSRSTSSAHSFSRRSSLRACVPDHSTLSRRAKTLEVPRPRPRRDGEPLHLLVDSTGLKLCDAGEWLIEKHGAKTRRSWRKCTLAWIDTGQMVAAALTTKEVDDGAQTGALLDQVAGPIANSPGSPSRLGNGTAAEREVCVSAGSPSIIGVRKR